MNPEQRAQIEQRLADAEEGTEQRMHAVADKLPDSETVHKAADRFSDRAAEHQRRAQKARDQREP